MIQDDPGRPTHHDDFYYDDIRHRDHDYFQDDRVTSRGFGILVDPNDIDDNRRPPEKWYRDERRERREPQRHFEVREPRRRSDDDLEIIGHEYDDREHRRHREHGYMAGEDVKRDRKDRRSDDDESDITIKNNKENIRDKVAAGVGLAAASIGLGSAVKGKDGKGRDSSPSRKHEDEDFDHPRHEEVDPRSRPVKKEPLLGDEEFEIVEHPRDCEKRREEKAAESETQEFKEKRDAPSASSSRDHSSSTDEGKTKSRRRLRASSFNPNDTAALAEMKARLAEIKAKDTADDKQRPAGKDVPSVKEPSPERKPSPVEKPEVDADASALVRKEDDENRELAPPSRDERQVRVVSPPKEAVPEKKPIKGILKQPRAQFPEEPNPVREGVAPHKDDKTKANVPPGARWTKISRKMVNPEALKIGKERFEVRDDFVIVLRVLSKEEIQAYAAATATLRGRFPAFGVAGLERQLGINMTCTERRKKEYEREMRGEAEPDDDRDRDGEDDDEKKRRHRQHRRDKDEDDHDRRERDRDRDRDREREREKEKEKDRHRRHKHESDDDDGHEPRRHHRSHRE
jgi:hypothetical protein